MNALPHESTFSFFFPSVHSILVSAVRVSPVSWNCSCSWSARAPDSLGELLRSLLLVNRYGTGTCLYRSEKDSDVYCSVSNFKACVVTQCDTECDSERVNASRFCDLKRCSLLVSAWIFLPSDQQLGYYPSIADLLETDRNAAILSSPSHSSPILSFRTNLLLVKYNMSKNKQDMPYFF